MLILFDIDRTLIETQGVGMGCLLDAGRSLFGDAFTVDGVPFGGRLDPLIIADILAASGVEHTAEHALAMRRGYFERMRHATRRPGVSRAWFNALYQVLLGQPEGPRFGGFVALYGIAGTIGLIETALARPAATLATAGDAAT